MSLSPIICDNTNVTFWEVKNYLIIARQYDYIVILVEPRTTHKFDPDKLASMFKRQKFNIKSIILRIFHFIELNKHSVSKDNIVKKLKMYQIVYPYYLGFFLNQNDSTFLIHIAQEIINQCLKQIQNFQKHIITSNKSKSKCFSFMSFKFNFNKIS